MFDSSGRSAQSPAAHSRRHASPLLRSVAAVLFLTAAFIGCSTISTQTRAYAFDVGNPLPVMLPRSIAPTLGLAAGGGGAGVGTVIATGGGGGAAAAGAAVAVAPLALAAGAVMAGAGAAYLAWKWRNGGETNADPDYGRQDPPPPPGQVSCNTATYNANCQPTTTWAEQQADYAGAATSDGSGGIWVGVARIGAFAGYEDGWEVGIYAKTYTHGTLTATCRDTAGTQVWTGSGSIGATSQIHNGRTVFRSFYGALPAGWAMCTFAPAPGTWGTSNSATAYAQKSSYTGVGGIPAGGAAPYAPGETPLTTTPRSTCSGGAVVNGPPITYKGNTPASQLPLIVAPACPAGQTRTGFTTPTTKPDGTTAPSPLEPWTAPTIPSGYPECQSGPCVLTLLQIAPDGRVTTCTQSTACYGWATDSTPERVTTEAGPATQMQRLPDGTTRTVIPRTRPDGSLMKCQWGPYTIPAAECETVPTERPTPDPHPRPRGRDIDETTGENCFAEAVSWNPINWVYVPIKCALTWAFVPRQTALQEDFGRIGDAWNGTAPASAAGAVVPVFSAFVDLKDRPEPTAGQCQGPAWTIPIPGRSQPWTMHPLSTCNELTQYVLGVVQPVVKAFILLTALLIGVRTVSRAIGTDGPVPAT